MLPAICMCFACIFKRVLQGLPKAQFHDKIQVMYKPLIRRGVSTGCRKEPSYIRRVLCMAVFAIHGDIIWTEEPGAFRYNEGGYLVISDGKVVQDFSRQT